MAAAASNTEQEKVYKIFTRPMETKNQREIKAEVLFKGESPSLTSWAPAAVPTSCLYRGVQSEFCEQSAKRNAER